MRDIKLTYSKDVGFDIDIIDGYPVYVDYENQTQDQRAAVGATIVKGTVPGSLEVGISWPDYFTQDISLLDIDNETRQMIDMVAGGTGQADSSYIPLYIPDEDTGQVNVTVVKGVTE